MRNSGWVQWRSVASYEPVAYSVTSSDSAIYDPTSWTLSASTDGTNWTTIHTVSGFSFTDRSQTQSFTVTNQNGLKYAYFKLQLSNTNSTKIKVAEWEIFGLLLPAGVNQKPVVAITSPVNSSTFTSPASITIVASASDYDGTITKVNFYAGSTRLFVDNSSPYTYTWTGVTSGSYTLKAVAYDNSGDSTASTLVLTTVNPPSTCTAQIWNATTAYNGGAVVQYNGIKYTANWWTQGDQPDTHSGPSGSGQPWINNGTCTSRQEQVTLASSVSLVPNPVENTATVQITAENNQYLSIYVVDIYGNKVLDVFNGEITDGTQSIPLYASSLSSGIYLLKTESNGNATFIRFIKN